jgi:predicted HicB family RNase H-like nuclease
MAQTSKAIRGAYDKKAYKQYLIRVRRDTDLNRWLEEYKDAGNSVNELIVQKLTEHFKHLVKLGVME